MMAAKKSGTADNAERQAKAKAKKNNVPQSTVTKGNRKQVGAVRASNNGRSQDYYLTKPATGTSSTPKGMTGTASKSNLRPVGASRAQSVALSKAHSAPSPAARRNNNKRK